MVAKTFTVGFDGVEARLVEVQCAIIPGMPSFSIVGLPDKAISEARERVKAALSALSIALPAKRITLNLSPADLPKEGAHFDLPIALAILAELNILPRDAVEQVISMGELALDGRLSPVLGALPAAVTAAACDKTLICPRSCGTEAAWIRAAPVLGAQTLGEVLRHFTGQVALSPAQPGPMENAPALRDLADLRGQERARRALEIAAAGRHHMLLVGPPGSGKTMLAQRLPSILPPLTASEVLETSMIHSLVGLIKGGGLSRNTPYREPHHSASLAAMVGGTRGARPGEVSLAHNGVLFLDELPEFPRSVIDALRQPLEAGEVMVARAQAHVSYPCRFLLVAAANPCRCGHLSDASRACARAPGCSGDYLGRISGPLLDRFDLRIEVPPVSVADLDGTAKGEPSAPVAARVAAARQIQLDRYAEVKDVTLNGDVSGALLEQFAQPDPDARNLLLAAADRMKLSARGYHRVLRVARTIADLDGASTVERPHIAEALSYRVVSMLGS